MQSLNIRIDGLKHEIQNSESERVEHELDGDIEKAEACLARCIIASGFLADLEELKVVMDADGLWFRLNDQGGMIS